MMQMTLCIIILIDQVLPLLNMADVVSMATPYTWATVPSAT